MRVRTPTHPHAMHPHVHATHSRAYRYVSFSFFFTLIRVHRQSIRTYMQRVRAPTCPRPPSASTRTCSTSARCVHQSKPFFFFDFFFFTNLHLHATHPHANSPHARQLSPHPGLFFSSFPFLFLSLSFSFFMLIRTGTSILRTHARQLSPHPPLHDPSACQSSARTYAHQPSARACMQSCHFTPTICTLHTTFSYACNTSVHDALASRVVTSY